jgi:hypothetical protein
MPNIQSIWGPASWTIGSICSILDRCRTLTIFPNTRTHIDSRIYIAQFSDQNRSILGSIYSILGFFFARFSCYFLLILGSMSLTFLFHFLNSWISFARFSCSFLSILMSLTFLFRFLDSWIDLLGAGAGIGRSTVVDMVHIQI